MKKIKLKSKSTQGGFLLVELLVASAIIVASFLSASGIAQKSLQVTRQGIHVAQASFILEEGAEAVRIVRDNSWDTFALLSTSTVYYPSYSGGTWSLVTVPENVGAFTRTVELDAVARDGDGDIAVSGTNDPDSRMVTVTVSWPEGDTTKEKEMSFYLSNIFEFGNE